MQLGAFPTSTRATQWWETWSSAPGLSPYSLANTERSLRLHVCPTFDHLQLRAIGPQLVQRWQNGLMARRGYPTVTAARSVLFRILQAAENEDCIPANPVRKVKAPKRPLDVEARFGHARPRTYTPEQFGRLVAAVGPWYRDHLLVHLATELRPSELLGLPRWRVNLPGKRLEVLRVWYDAGPKFGKGYKDKTKSDAGTRPVPLSTRPLEIVTRRFAAADPMG